MGMGTYKIKNVDLYTSIKYLVWSNILAIASHQWCAIPHEGHQWYENNEARGSSCYVTSITSDQGTSMDDNMVTKMSTLSLSSFVHNYMVNK